MEVSVTAAKVKKTRVPPIKFIPPDSWAMLLDSLKRIAPNTRSKAKGKYLSLTFDSVDDYRQAQQYLLRNNINYHSYLLDDAKPLRVVFRGFPSTPASMIFC